MPDDSSQYVPPWRLPPEESVVQEQKAPPQPPQEGNQAPPTPEVQFSFFKETTVSFLIFFLFYWTIYLVINYNTRILFGLGLTDFPLPPNIPSALGLSGVGLAQLFQAFSWWPTLSLPYLLPFGFAVSFLIFASYRKLRINKSSFAKFVLLTPVVVFVLAIIATIFVSQYSTCEGLGCLPLVAPLLLVFYFSVATYIAIFLSNIFLSLAKRFNFIFPVLIILSVSALVLPILIPVFFITSFEERIVRNEMVKIVKVKLKKVEISKETYSKVTGGKLNSCCSILDKRFGGDVVLKELEGNKFLIGGPVQVNPKVDYEEQYKADLFLEENGELTNITKGLEFQSLYSKISDEGDGTRPSIISPPKDKIAFFKEYVDRNPLYIVKLDGTGVFMDENFCPWNCRIQWGNDGFIYTHVELKRKYVGNRFFEREVYWKVTPPK
jgi:hypothetical protein